MAPQQESSKGGGAAITPTMEEEEEEEEEEHHRHGERPLLSACEQEQQEASKPLPLPLPVKRRRSMSLSRSSRSGEQEDGARSLSFSRLFSSFRMLAASSTAVDIDQLAAAQDGRAALNPPHQHHQQPPPKPVCRTQSLPMTSISRRLPAPHGHGHGHAHHRKRVADSSSLRRFRVSSSSAVPSSPLPQSSPPSSPSPSEEEAGGEEVGEEEAVCRICMVALGEDEEDEEEDGAVLKLECRCKGELALAHRRCALKWFGIKGNPNCDVCGHDVLNLPVTLRRLPLPLPPPPPTAGNDGGGNGSQEEEEGEGEGERRRGLRGVWRHGTVVLVAVSMLAYFCFLEQLLVGDHGSNAAAALAVSVPFAVVLGTFSALTTAGMVSSRRYVWAYSALQFLLVVLFTHLFYRYVRLQAVIAIILSTFAGFGVAICANAVLLQAVRWRAAVATARHPPPPPSSSDQDLHQTPQP